jgi:YD repeat-containing protein
MESKFINARRIALSCAMISFYLVGISQSVASPKMETPNVASMEKFGDVPVDLATGVPNISIPIHTLHYGNIDVPISLRYHPGALRVAQHPGWVGFGWDLASGGAITRTIREYPDEYYGQYIMPCCGALNSTYYPEPVSSPPLSGSEVINNNGDWDTRNKLISYFQSVGTSGLYDVSADEFSFNFMGYSGKFYYEGPSQGWKAVSDQNIQVNVINPANPCLTGDAVLATIINQYSTPGATGHLYPYQGNAPQEAATRVFSGFVLTVPDGTKYYFGGVDANNNGIGIEFFTPYGARGGVQFFTNTWLLTKIVDADNNEVDFNYSASYPTADLGFGYNANTWNCQVKTGGRMGSDYFSGWTSGPINVNYHSGTLFLPLYLDNISCNAETITFNRDKSNNCLRFSDNVFRYIDVLAGTDLSNQFDLHILDNGHPELINGINLQWEQLNSIVVSNNYNQIFRRYSFTYSNSSAQRLSLTSFQELDNTGASLSTATSIKKYSFLYNNIAALPYYDGNSTDHWGFYNGPESIGNANPTFIDAASGSIYTFKQTNPTVATTGALTQITYPTGGYTTFTWAAHDYSQVVSQSRNSLLNQLGNAGGLRIAEVKTYLPNGAVALDKKYLYVRGYSKANPNGSSSSGILNGTPTYYMALNNRMSANQSLMESITVTSLNSLAVYSYNSQASYIGYDEVVEVDGDGSYTKSFFTSYGPDVNGVSHWDMLPIGSLGWLAGTDNYFPMNTLENERGKLIAVYKYSSNDVLVQKTINTYRNDAGRFNNYLRIINFNGAYSGCASYDALILATANRVFTYDYYVTNQLVTNYDQLGENPIITSASYTYNANNLVSAKTETNSKGESMQTAYTYPNEITSSDPTYSTCQAMTNAHIISPVIQTVVTNNATQLSLTKTNYYSPRTGMYKPQNIQVKIGSNPIETRQQFYSYDSYGNVQELSKTNDAHEVYLWSYKGQYPVAKISGSTLSAVSAIVSQSQIDAATSTANNDAAVRDLLKNLRTGLPGSLVTYYTYLPVTGITSETDPRGQTTFYQYDNFQRLKTISDFNNNILKTFKYQYQVNQ